MKEKTPEEMALQSQKRRIYRTRHMTKMRSYYKTLWQKGKIAYEDIPKSYRYWKNV